MVAMKLLNILMEAMNIYILAAAIACAIIWHVVERVWVRPRRLERSLRAQGFKGNPYRLWFGDAKDHDGMIMATHSKPMGLHDDTAPYVLPFHHHILTKYGKRSFTWHGPNPRILLMNPDMIKDVLQKNETFLKVEPSAQVHGSRYLCLALFDMRAQNGQNIAAFSIHLSPLPSSRYLPTEKSRRMKKINMEISDMLSGVIQKRMEGMKAGEDESSSDLLGILLESNIKEVEENRDREETGIKIHEVMEECKLFYFAGQETTSNLLVWTIVMLGIHQNWQMEARQEVFEVFGKSMPNFDGLHQLKKGEHDSS